MDLALTFFLLAFPLVVVTQTLCNLLLRFISIIMAHKDVVLVAFFLPQQNFKMKSSYIKAAVSYCKSASLY